MYNIYLTKLNKITMENGKSSVSRIRCLPPEQISQIRRLQAERTKRISVQMIDQQRNTTSVFSALFAISALNDKSRLIGRESSYLRAYKAPLQLSRILYKSALFMQNKPNFKIGKMDINSIVKRNYENKCLRTPPENKPNSNPKQTQTNPIARGA